MRWVAATGGTGYHDRRGGRTHRQGARETRGGALAMMQKPQAGPAAPPAERRGAQDSALVDVLRGEALARGDRAAALRAITEAATRALDVERASVWLYNERRNRI